MAKPEGARVNTPHQQQNPINDPWREGAVDVQGAMQLAACGRTWLFEAMARGDVAWAPLGGKAGAKRVIARASLLDLLRRNAQHAAGAM